MSRKEEQCKNCLFALPLHVYLKECMQQQFCKTAVQNPQPKHERCWSLQFLLSSLGIRDPLIRLLLHQNFFRDGHQIRWNNSSLHSFFAFSTSYSQHCKKYCRILEDLRRTKESKNHTGCPRHVLNYSEHSWRVICCGVKARQYWIAVLPYIWASKPYKLYFFVASVPSPQAALGSHKGMQQLMEKYLSGLTYPSNDQSHRVPRLGLVCGVNCKCTI